MKRWLRFLLACVLFVLLPFVQMGTANVSYAQGKVLGIHVLSPSEVTAASVLLSTPDNAMHFVTVPLTIADTMRPTEWQHFFDIAHDSHLRPIIRLATEFTNGAWRIPTRSDVMQLTAFLSALDWHDTTLTVVLFNEPNHANEWGGKIDPIGFAQISNFSLDWLKTEQKQYIVLPAGLDLAATNTPGNMEAFTFLTAAFQPDPTFIEKFDGWTSHSYPNPGFSSSPKKTDKLSLRGYQYELSFLAKYTSKPFPVYITETGWNNDAFRRTELKHYFQVAYDTIWKSDPRIKAVTPFLLQGMPGAFAAFSFLDGQGHPTPAYQAYRDIVVEKN